MVSGPDEKLERRAEDNSPGRVVGELGDLAVRLVPAATTALSTSSIGGLIPHVKHGGSDAGDAIAGSKLSGTGLVKVQIGQTQLAERVGCWLLADGAGRKGLLVRDPGEDDDCCTRCMYGFGDREFLWDPAPRRGGLG